MSQFDRLPPAGERNNLPASNYYDVLEEIYEKENRRFLEEERLKEETRLRKEALDYQESHINFYKNEIEAAYDKLDRLESKVRKIKSSEERLESSIRDLNTNVQKLKDYIYHKDNCRYLAKINCGRKIDDVDEEKDCSCGCNEALKLVKTIQAFSLKELLGNEY